MQFSEEQDFRDGLVYDPFIKSFDSNFFHGDTANMNVDTVKSLMQGGAIKIGDTGLVGSMSSYSQYLYGDFEFIINTDCFSPDSNDSEKRWGLLNIGDPLERGAIYFNASYDTLTGADTAVTNQLWATIRDEWGNRNRKRITWDSNWGNAANTRYRIKWEADNIQFLINDTVMATMGDKADTANSVAQFNQSIPQAIRVSNRSLDTTDTAPMRLRLLNIRNARKVI